MIAMSMGAPSPASIEPPLTAPSTNAGAAAERAVADTGVTADNGAAAEGATAEALQPSARGVEGGSPDMVLEAGAMPQVAQQGAAADLDEVAGAGAVELATSDGIPDGMPSGAEV